MEQRFGTRFADVRIHSDKATGQTVLGMGARAVTRGPNIYFAAGHYEPSSPVGRSLLAHELTHVVQQRNGRFPLPSASATAARDRERLESEARQAEATRHSSDAPVQVLGKASMDEAHPSLLEDVAARVFTDIESLAEFVLRQIGDSADALMTRLNQLRLRLRGLSVVHFRPGAVAELEGIYHRARALLPSWVPAPHITFAGTPAQFVVLVDDAAVAILLLLLMMFIVVWWATVGNPESRRRLARDLERAVELIEEALRPTPLVGPTPVPRPPPPDPPKPAPEPPDIAPAPPRPAPRPTGGRPRPRPETEPRPRTEPRTGPEPRPEPDTTTDPIPPLPEDKRRRLPPVDFFHGTDASSATSLSGGTPVRSVGRGEFGAGFYTFIRQAPAELAAADYTRRRGLPMWGVVDFRVPVEPLLQYGLFESIQDLLSVSHVLIFPDRTTRVSVRYPEDQGGLETELNWREFVAENRRMGRSVSWPYDLIIGPLSGTLAGFRNENQFLFNNDGVILLNDPRVRRSVVANGPT